MDASALLDNNDLVEETGSRCRWFTVVKIQPDSRSSPCNDWCAGLSTESFSEGHSWEFALSIVRVLPGDSGVEL